MPTNPYYLYILKCSDQTLYTGITTDLKRRLEEHNESTRGAKYTRGRRPTKLIYSKRFANRSRATIAEAQIKKLALAEKLTLIKNKYDQGKLSRNQQPAK
jgi:putative endonuclease